MSRNPKSENWASKAKCRSAEYRMRPDSKLHHLLLLELTAFGFVFGRKRETHFRSVSRAKCPGEEGRTSCVLC